MKKVLDLALSYDDVLLIPQYSEIKSRSDVDLSTQITPHINLKIPLVSSNMSSITDVKFAISLAELGGLGILPRFMSIEKEANMVEAVKRKKVLVGAAVGVKEETIDRAKALVSAGCDLLVLDVANGHMKQAIDTTIKLKRLFGNTTDIVAGNVATYEGAENLFKAGADSVKVGIGPGSTCITRMETGCGVPQISAVLDCAVAAKKHNRTIICDGGMKNSGDIVKALAAGASAIMTGHLFAGIKETAGKTITKDGIKYKEYNGSTSLIEKSRRTSGSPNHIEGVAGFVVYQGDLKTCIERITDNMRSGFSYVGAKNISEISKKAKFVHITSMGYRESGSHDLII